MNVKPLVIVNSVVIASMAALSVWAWQSIPGDAQIPVHWGLDGVPDRYGSKVEALIVLPIIAAVLTAIMWFLPRIDPRRAHLESSAKMWNAVTIAIAGLLAYVHVLLVLGAMGRRFDMTDYMIPAIAVMFIIIGNYISKTRSNWFAGVRTPWSMSSEYSWTKTHRLASKLFMGSGVLTLVTWLIAGAKVATVVFIAAILITAIGSVVVSYVYWKNDPARTDAAVNGHA